VDLGLAKHFNITERVKVEFRIDAFNFFNHPQYGSLGNNQGLVNIGFNAPNTAASPEFLDKNGNPIIPTATNNGLANAASIQNSTPNAQVGTVGTTSDRNREFQYSLRFTF